MYCIARARTSGRVSERAAFSQFQSTVPANGRASVRTATRLLTGAAALASLNVRAAASSVTV